MKEIVNFLTNHGLLSSIFLFLLVVWVLLELKSKGQDSQSIQAQELVLKMNHDEATVLDIRADTSFKEGHIIGSINVPSNMIEQKLNSLNKYQDKKLVVVCNMGVEASKVAKQLKDKGFTEVVILSGGLQAWKAAGLPLQKIK